MRCLPPGQARCKLWSPIQGLSLGLLSGLLLVPACLAWGTIRLAWDDHLNAPETLVRYVIQRSTDGEVSWQSRAHVRPTARTWTDTAPPARPVCYRVVAVGHYQRSGPSNVVCLDPPAAPTGLQGAHAP